MEYWEELAVARFLSALHPVIASQIHGHVLRCDVAPSCLLPSPRFFEYLSTLLLHTLIGLPCWFMIVDVVVTVATVVDTGNVSIVAIQTTFLTSVEQNLANQNGHSMLLLQLRLTQEQLAHPILFLSQAEYDRLLQSPTSLSTVATHAMSSGTSAMFSSSDGDW